MPSGAKNELAILQKQLTEAQNAKVTKTPPSSYLAGDAYNDVISPMQEAQVRIQCSRSARSDMERPVLSVRKGWAKASELSSADAHVFQPPHEAHRI